MKSEPGKTKRVSSSSKKIKTAIKAIAKETEQPNLLVRIIRKLTRSTPASTPVLKKKETASKPAKYQEPSLKVKGKNPLTREKIASGKLFKKDALTEKIDLGAKQKEIASKKSLDFQKDSQKKFKEFQEKTRKDFELTRKKNELIRKNTDKILKDTRDRFRANRNKF